MSNAKSTSNVTSNSQEIGYLHGKIEMLEKKFDEHRDENRKEMESVIEKLTLIVETMSFWRHTLWIVKIVGLSIPLVLTANFEQLLNLWKG